jgi:hypothetical protein
MRLVSFTYSEIEELRDKHPAWRLLCAEHAPLILTFLHRVFIKGNVRVMEQPELIEALEDELYGHRERYGEKAYPKTALEYLNDWASPQKGWMRKFYTQSSDEPQFDLTPPTEKAISWIASLTERSFVGTESRLMTLFDLLKNIVEGTETDRDVRKADLLRRRAELDAQIERLDQGDFELLQSTAVKERFQQFVGIARDLLSDFRQVEQNFRGLDRRAREQIATWDGSRGQLLDYLFGQRDQITDSDEGRSFRAFWDFLMSQSRQEELTTLLERVLLLEPVQELRPDGRLRRVHYDWMEAGDQTQQTVRLLSEQLRRFLDDRTLQENRRIVELLRSIEKRSIEIKANLPSGDFMEVESAVAQIELPFERPLYSPKEKVRIREKAIVADEGEVDAMALFDQELVDRKELKRHVHRMLTETSHVTLKELVLARPLEYGLAELLAYMELTNTNSSAFRSMVDESVQDEIFWVTARGTTKKTTMSRVIFSR